MRLAAVLLCVVAAAQSPMELPQLDRTPLASLERTVREQVEDALRRKDYPAAERLLVAALEAKPEARLYAFLGGLFFLHGEYLNAGIALKKADALTPLGTADRFTLALSYVVLKMPDKAAAELLRLEQAAPGDARYPYWLGRIAYDAQRFEEAVRQYERALKLDPSNVRVHDNLGLAYEALGNNDGALASYRRATELNRAHTPCSGWPAHNLGALLRKLGELDEAAAAIAESLRCAPRFARALYQQGLLSEQRGEAGAAVESLRAAVAAEPSYAEPYYVLARLLRKQGKSEEAAEALRAFDRLKGVRK